MSELVVVTGAGSGIGRATALAFAARGARIAACDIDAARIAALAAELGDRAVVARVVDVADRAAMAAFADEVHRHAPAADVVVNNAGVAVAGSFLDLSLDDWDWLLGVNLRGVVHGCHFFAPQMRARGRGQLINLASILGLVAVPQVTAYAASKFAVLGFSQSLRAELAPHGVGVTAICPGMIATAIVEDGRYRGAITERRARVASVFKRGAAPETVASAIVESARSNPAVRLVGRDSWALWAMSRVAPRTLRRLHGVVARHLGAAG